MGSFNTSCALTGLPIAGGDKVKLFFVQQQAKDMAGCSCYSTDFAKPITYPLDATYDDYNRYEVDDDQEAAQLLMSYIKNYGIKLEQGENQYHDIAVDPKNFDYVNDLFDPIHEGRLRVGGILRDEVPVFHVAIHQDAWDQIMGMKMQQWNGAVNLTDIYESIFEKYSDSKAKIDDKSDMLEGVLDNMEEELKGKGTEEDEILTKIKDMKRMLLTGMGEGIFKEGYNGVVQKSHPEPEYNSKEDMRLIEKHIMDHAQMQLLSIVLNEINFMWHNIMTSGQDVEHENQRQFHERMIDAIDGVAEKWHERWGE